MPKIEDLKRESVITIKLGYMEGSQAPDYVRVDSDCSIVDLLIAREAISTRINEKVDNPSEFLAGAFEAFAKDFDPLDAMAKGDNND